MKKKLYTRKTIVIMTAIIFTVVLICAFITIKPVTVYYGTSEIYAEQDLTAAVEMIQDKVNSMRGCKLYSLSYKGDEYCVQELDDCNSLKKDGEPFTECVVFDSCFRSPVFGGDGLNANYIYDWDWYLARTENGQWEIITFGY